MKDKFLETIILNSNTNNMEAIEKQIESVAKTIEHMKYFEVDKKLIKHYEKLHKSLTATLSVFVDIENYLYEN